MHLLSRMTPLALVQMIFCAFAFGELSDLASNWEVLKGGTALYVVALTGVGSFSLNLTSLQANKVTSPLTLSIMANLKQVSLACVGVGVGFGVDFGAVVLALDDAVLFVRLLHILFLMKIWFCLLSCAVKTRT